MTRSMSPARQRLNELCNRPLENVQTHGELVQAVFNIMYVLHPDPAGWQHRFYHWAYTEGITNGVNLRVMKSYAAATPLTYLGQRLAKLTMNYSV